MQNTLWILWFKATINYIKYLICDKTISTDTYVFMLSNFPQQQYVNSPESADLTC